MGKTSKEPAKDAKTTTETTEEPNPNYSMVKQGSGWRNCPECLGATKGPRSPKCLGCGYEFPATTTGSKGKGKQSGLANVKATIALIKKAGGIEAIENKIKTAEKALEALKELGGVQGAKTAIETLKEIDGLLKAK